MSERKMDDIETMFKKTARPKTVIDEYPKINRIGVVLDSSKKGENALRVAVDLAIRLKTSLHVIVSEDYYQQFDTLIESSKKGLNDLQALAEKHAGDAGIKTDIEQVIGKKLRAIINAFDQETQSGDTLGGRLIERIKESGAQIMVIGVPMFKSREDHSPHESLGTYVFMLLRERTIPANFLLVSEQTEVVADSVLAFVSVEQQPASIVALYRRALSFATEKTDFKLIGMVNDKVIETVARLDMPVDDPSATLDLDTAKQKLVRRLEETLESISLKKELDDAIILGSPTWEVKTGNVAEIVRESIENTKPGIVFVRSVAELTENLDPFAEAVTRQVLSAGYGCLIVWD